MDLKKMLSGRIHQRDIRMVCAAAAGVSNPLKDAVFELVVEGDDRTSYNALWVFTHFTAADKGFLNSKRDVLIDILLTTGHVGKKRLILTLLEGLKTTGKDIRTDYLDFCLSRINSSEAYGIRSLCLKQAFVQCRFYPELMTELLAEMDMMEFGELGPGLRSARRIVKRRIEKQIEKQK